MLRLTQKFGRYYLNAPKERYAKLYPLEAEKKKFKTEMVVGESPEYLYDAKIKFDPQYVPYEKRNNHSFAVMACSVLVFMIWRYEKMRKAAGRTLTHEFPI
jgi:hypothetical protein